MDKQVLKLESLSIGYDETIVPNINTVVKQGDFIALFGANGAGKSTLIKTILQQLPPKSGQILFNLKNISDYSNLELAQNIAIVNTNKNFDLNLTVYDILALGRTPYLNLLGTLIKRDKDIITQYSNELNIKPLLTRYFHQLSDGQKQKVLIARALIQDTPLIILDEPTAHLDIKNRIQIFSLLQTIAVKNNKSIICATHEIDIALKHAYSVWILDKKSQFQDYSPKELTNEAVYNQLF